MFSDPVVGENFFGRQDIIDLLIKRANALKSGYRQNVALIGHQQLGKTSLLRHFLHIYRDSQILPIYVEIKFQALDYFVDQFVRSLLFQYLSEKEKLPASASLGLLTEKAKLFIPKTVGRIVEITALLKQRHTEEAYSRLFELTSVVREETGKSCIVVLDEFHRLGEFGLKNAFSGFGKKIMFQKDTMYLLSSSSFSASRKILAEKLALLFGNFERIYLEPFDFKTSFEFLETKLLPVAVPANLKHFLVAFTDGHPFFMDTIATRLKEHSAAKGELSLSPRTVAEVWMRLLFDSQGVLHQFFLKLISPWTHASSRGSHVLILVEIAKGSGKLKDIAGAINRGQTETSRQIQELVEHELILKNGVFHRFHNRIFKFWLKEVYERKELSVLGERATPEDFVCRFEEIIAEYEEFLKIDVSERLKDLFLGFRNDLIEWGEKGRKLPHFTEILTLTEPSGVPAAGPRGLIAKGRGRCWVCKIVEEKATEKEVLELVHSVSLERNYSATKVLVALRGVEDNARLLAKEKHVLTLGLSRLNMLMELYGKFPLVRV